jgi:hypothetical protein
MLESDGFIINKNLTTLARSACLIKEGKKIITSILGVTKVHSAEKENE